MKNIRKLTLLSAILSLSLEVSAACQATYCDNVKVENLYITATGEIYVFTSGAESNLNCSGTSNGEYLTLNTSDKNYKEIYSALLSARTIDQPMKININDGSVGCTIERVEYGIYFN